jgi:pentatricopeptide repeat protein
LPLRLRPQVMETFQEMVWKGCERSVITYSSLISACEKAGQWELALELFDEMHREGCSPNTVTFNSLITATAQGGGVGRQTGRQMPGGPVSGVRAARAALWMLLRSIADHFFPSKKKHPLVKNEGKDRCRGVDWEMDIISNFLNFLLNKKKF